MTIQPEGPVVRMRVLYPEVGIRLAVVQIRYRGLLGVFAPIPA